jgi:hypothetical protein
VPKTHQNIELKTELIIKIMSTKRKKKIRKPAVKANKVPKLGWGQESKNITTLKEIERCDDLESDFNYGQINEGD